MFKRMKIVYFIRIYECKHLSQEFYKIVDAVNVFTATVISLLHCFKFNIPE